MSDPTIPPADWTALATTWQTDSPSAPNAAGLREHIARETRRMRRWLAGELALSASLLVASLWVLAVHGGSFTLLLALDTWGMLAVVWAFALWSRRGAWRPLADTTEAYVALARRRARMRLRTAYFIVAVLAIQFVVVCLPVPVPGTWHGGWEARMLSGLVAVAYLAYAVRLRQTARRELAQFGEP